MISVSVRKLLESGRILVTRSYAELSTTYVVDPANGSPAQTIRIAFPSGKYSALETEPTWAGHRFIGWYTAQNTPSASATPTSGSRVLPTDAVPYGAGTVYGAWQLPTTITFDATTGGGSMPSGWTAPDYYEGQPFGTLPTPTHATLSFGGWYLNGAKVTAATLVPAGGAALVAQFVSSSFSVDLNDGAWVLDSSINPDSSAYDGVYKSTNAGQDETMAKMYIDVVGYTSFRVLIASYSEPGYDYTVAMDADVDPSDMPSDSWGERSKGVKASTSENSYADPSSPGNYVTVDYALDGGQHRICILYRKDASYGDGDDRGYVLIPLDQGGAS